MKNHPYFKGGFSIKRLIFPHTHWGFFGAVSEPRSNEPWLFTSSFVPTLPRFFRAFLYLTPIDSSPSRRGALLQDNCAIQKSEKFFDWKPLLSMHHGDDVTNLAGFKLANRIADVLLRDNGYLSKTNRVRQPPISMIVPLAIPALGIFRVAVLRRS